MFVFGHTNSTKIRIAKGFWHFLYQFNTNEGNLGEFFFEKIQNSRKFPVNLVLVIIGKCDTMPPVLPGFDGSYPVLTQLRSVYVKDDNRGK